MPPPAGARRLLHRRHPEVRVKQVVCVALRFDGPVCLLQTPSLNSASCVTILLASFRYSGTETRSQPVKHVVEGVCFRTGALVDRRQGGLFASADARHQQRRSYIFIVSRDSTTCIDSAASS